MLLLERFQNGDESAMDALIEKHQTRAYQLAFRLTRNPELAADVVAEAFVRVYRAAKRFRGQAAFSTWLHRIVTNCFLDHRKKASSRPSISLNAMLGSFEDETEWEIAAEEPSPFDYAVSTEREEAIHEALGTLKESHRAMIMMFHSDQLSYEEIADTLDLPIGTVKSRLNRARLALRQVLTPVPAFQSDLPQVNVSRGNYMAA